MAPRTSTNTRGNPHRQWSGAVVIKAGVLRSFERLIGRTGRLPLRCRASDRPNIGHRGSRLHDGAGSGVRLQRLSISTRDCGQQNDLPMCWGAELPSGRRAGGVKPWINRDIGAGMTYMAGCGCGRDFPPTCCVFDEESGAFPGGNKTPSTPHYSFRKASLQAWKGDHRHKPRDLRRGKSPFPPRHNGRQPMRFCCDGKGGARRPGHHARGLPRHPCRSRALLSPAALPRGSCGQSRQAARPARTHGRGAGADGVRLAREVAPARRRGRGCSAALK